MADGIEINVSGISETVRRLRNYSLQMSDTVTIRALDLGSKVMRKAVADNAPVSTKGKFPGRLKRSIIKKKSKIHSRQRDGIVGYYIVARKRGKTNNPNNGYYAPWVQNGWEARGKIIGRGGRRVTAGSLASGRKTTRTGVMVAGNPFINRAYQSNKSNTESLISTAIERGSAELASRLGL